MTTREEHEQEQLAQAIQATVQSLNLERFEP